MLHVVTWLWGTKYGLEDVRKLQDGVARNLRQSHRFFVARPQVEDEYLTKIPGCFCRLRMFDLNWQKRMEIEDGDRVVCIDLDVVVTGELDALFNRAERFVILQGANSSNPCKFNGSIFMFRAGAYPEIWSEFSLEKAKTIPKFSFADDQGWFWHLLPNAAGWNVGSRSGIYAFHKPAWPHEWNGSPTNDLPTDARMVVFPGWRSPEKFKHLPWVKEHWR